MSALTLEGIREGGGGEGEGKLTLNFLALKFCSLTDYTMALVQLYTQFVS